MNHVMKKRGVPDIASGTPPRSVCGILCGQQKSVKSYSFKKLQKAKENTRNPKISGVVLELLGGFEPPTSSLPTRPKNFFRAFLLVFSHFRSVSITLWCSLNALLPSVPSLSVAGYVVKPLTRRKGNIKPLHNRRSGLRISHQNSPSFDKTGLLI